MSNPRRRLDAVLVERGLARSRGEARECIAAGRVTIDGAPATKPATLVARGADLVVAEPGPRWASRGGEKLAGGLERLGLDVAGRHALDVGAAHGGFTDVLLSRGVVGVVAVDVGYGQLAWRLATDPRVVVLDRTNARHLRAEALPWRPDLVVGDLSFISLTLVLPALARVAADAVDLVLLCKPQFEAGRGAVGRDGVVRDPAEWERAMRRVVDAATEEGLGLVGAVPSSLRGPAGNVEFVLHLARGRGGTTAEDPAALTAAAVDEARAAG